MSALACLATKPGAIQRVGRAGTGQDASNLVCHMQRNALWCTLLVMMVSTTCPGSGSLALGHRAMHACRSTTSCTPPPHTHTAPRVVKAPYQASMRAMRMLGGCIGPFFCADSVPGIALTPHVMGCHILSDRLGLLQPPKVGCARVRRTGGRDRTILCVL